MLQISSYSKHWHICVKYMHICICVYLYILIDIRDHSWSLEKIHSFIPNNLYWKFMWAIPALLHKVTPLNSNYFNPGKFTGLGWISYKDEDRVNNSWKRTNDNPHPCGESQFYHNTKWKEIIHIYMLISWSLTCLVKSKTDLRKPQGKPSPYGEFRLAQVRGRDGH